MYTNYKFWGVSDYVISVHNYYSGAMNVHVYDASDDDYADFSFEVPGFTTIVTRKHMGSTSDQLYLYFFGGQLNFDGYIDES